MFEIDILRNFSQKDLGVLRGAFYGFGCPKRHPDALLAKTMPQGLSQDFKTVCLKQLLGSFKSLFQLDLIAYCVSLQPCPRRYFVIQVNLDMTDSMRLGKLVRHKQNPS